jgi:hypothetical protein
VVVVSALLWAGAGAATDTRRPFYWVPDDVPDELKRMVPEKYHKTTFGIGWMINLRAQIEEGKDPIPDPIRAYQCSSFLWSAMQTAKSLKPRQFPDNLRDFRRKRLAYWGLDALKDAANLKQEAEVHAMAGPPLADLLRDYGDRFSVYETLPAPETTSAKPGDVVFLPKAVARADRSRVAFALTLLCASEAGPPPSGEFDSEGSRRVSRPKLMWHRAQIIWRLDRPPSDTPSVWADFGPQIHFVLEAFYLNKRTPPGTMEDLETVFGKRNKAMWTREMERIVTEYHIPRLQQAFARKSDATN